MTSRNPHPCAAPWRALHRCRRAGTLALASAMLALLAACGGGGETEVPSATEAQAEGEAEKRRFVLWAPGHEAAVRAEQRALQPEEGGDTVRLLVRLNPAAVMPVSRLAIAATPGSGEAGDAAALHARRLAAKAAAVGAAADGVLARAVWQQVPGARIQRQFAHAVEGFVTSVPWHQAQAVADQLALDPAVDAVELDQPVSVGQVAVARTLDTRAWGVDRIDRRERVFDGQFASAYGGSGVQMYVVDTGVSPHREFGDRLRPGYSVIADGQGTRDCQGHGTHVAGTAAGSTVGVAPGASVVPVRVLDCRGSGSSSGVIAGLDWIAAHGTKPGVVNLSLGGPASSTTDAAVQRLIAAGFTVVAAAGNENVDACTRSPARAPGSITVAASDAADAKASFSNWGSCVGLWAPGTNIGSSGIAGSTAVVALSGTSMAAPHVAGAAALLLQERPALAAAQVMELLQARATANAVTGAPGTMTRSLLFAGPAAPIAGVLPPRLGVAELTLSTQVPTPGRWTATAALRVVDEQGQPVAGVKVAGRFSSSSRAVNCTTASDGSCRIASAAASWSTVPQIGFAVTELALKPHADGGSGPRQAQVARPAPPVATVASISGEMLASSRGAGQWTPRFTVRVVDEDGSPIAGAEVRALLTAHAGAQAVGLRTTTCKTAASGQCTLSWSGSGLSAIHTGATLQIVGISRTFLVYQPGAGAMLHASIGRTQ